MALGNQPARFTGPGCASPQEMLRWEEFGWLGRISAKLEVLKAEIEKHYPGLTMPDVVAEAVDALDAAGDALRKRRNALEDGE